MKMKPQKKIKIQPEEKLGGGLRKILFKIIFLIFYSNISYSSQIFDFETEKF